MNTKLISKTVITFFLFLSCGSRGGIISTPYENIDSSPLKVMELTEAEKKNWGYLDLEKDTIPGMSINRTYKEIIKNKKGKKVIVAVIDSGIDIDHEDLNSIIWTNQKEIPDNGKDDDQNGYVDDIHGWNFLGDAYDEQLEYVRLLRGENTSNPRYKEAEALLEKEISQAKKNKQHYSQLLQKLITIDEALTKHFNTNKYTLNQVIEIESTDEQINQYKGVAQNMKGYGFETMSDAIKEIKSGVTYFTERLDYHFNINFLGRKTKDDINDFNDIGYGNGNVKPMVKDESHGTHVAGIIAAERNNGKGINGVANNVEIMALRTVPNGDEYDKDVALAIRYAVNNGAKVINASFGKSFSPHANKVRDAIRYASENNVVLVHAAGNDGNNVDIKPNFPDDNVNFIEVASSYIRVGSLTSEYGSRMVSNFSNYGHKNVDIFAPGSNIYSTMPENEYDFQSGTSMAAPSIAGLAALIRSYFPKLTAAQVKQVILDSGLALNTKVIVGGNPSNVKQFDELSTSGRIANAFNALIMASKIK